MFWLGFGCFFLEALAIVCCVGFMVLEALHRLLVCFGGWKWL